MLDRLIRAIYRPHHTVVFHVDAKVSGQAQGESKERARVCVCAREVIPPVRGDQARRARASPSMYGTAPVPLIQRK